MADETAPTERTRLGHSRIFTPEVINDIHVKSEWALPERGFSIFRIPHWDDLVFLPGTLTASSRGLREKCETAHGLGRTRRKEPKSWTSDHSPAELRALSLRRRWRGPRRVMAGRRPGSKGG